MITIHRCAGGHEFFHAYDHCPDCGAPLDRADIDDTAELVVETTVRVNPGGLPFRLGVARVFSGARTLCIIEEDAPTGSGATVRLRRVDGVYRAGTAQNRTR